MTERSPLSHETIVRAQPFGPRPDLSEEWCRPADLSDLVCHTPDDPSCAVSRACRRIEAALKTNLGYCANGLFGRTACVGTPVGLHGGPTLVALIDADPHSLIDHWYGLVGYWHGRQEGMVAGLIRLPMVDAPDMETLITRIQSAWVRSIQRRRPDRRQEGTACLTTQDLYGPEEKPGLGSRLQFLRLRHRGDHVFWPSHTFEGAVHSLEEMVLNHDRELRRSPAIWWTDQHPGDRLVEQLSQTWPRMQTPHFWPILPRDALNPFFDTDLDFAQEDHCFLDVLRACPQRERSVFTRPCVRIVNLRNDCPDVLVFAGRRKGGRNWIYGRIQLGQKHHFAGLIPMPAFLDADRNIDLFEVLQKDVGEPLNEAAPKDVYSDLVAQLRKRLLDYFSNPPPNTGDKSSTGAMP